MIAGEALTITGPTDPLLLIEPVTHLYVEIRHRTVLWLPSVMRTPGTAPAFLEWKGARDSSNGVSTRPRHR
jgi:hypothetical protein